MNKIIRCKECNHDFKPDRHSIQEYNFTRVDDVIEGDFDLKCPFCGARYLMVFEAEITISHYWKD